MKEFTVLIVAGGTGGHISPGLALYEEFKARGCRVLFLSGKRDARFSYLKEISDDLLLYGAPAFSKNPLKLAFFPLRFWFAVLKSKRILRKRGVDAVIGMGGYVSAPMLYAARKRGVALYLCEQNSVPGKVTRYFSRYARGIFSTFEVTRGFLKYDAGFACVGNPIRKKVFVVDSKENAKAVFNLKHCRKVILAIGGSQGALRINELMLGLKKSFPDDFKNIGIIWSTGDLSYAEYKRRIREEVDEGSVFLSPFINNVGMAYLASDIAVSRAGSGVMMELAAMGLPSLLIPYPFAADNHQDLNADEFDKLGAAVKVKNEDAAPEKVAPVLFGLLNHGALLEKMRESALSASKKNAAADIASIVMKDANVKENGGV
jgi:UDP-N-acetylglucosamine--N-acetylmuramyl-(pentapeptide) pyrophosphoryl-undecaprenol N-acetylglucosamine transferase